MEDNEYSVIDSKDGIKIVSSKEITVKEEDSSLPKTAQLQHSQSVKSIQIADNVWPKCSIIRILDFTGACEKRQKLNTEQSTDIVISNEATDRAFRRKHARKYSNQKNSENKSHISKTSEDHFSVSNKSTITDLSSSCSCASVKTCDKLFKIVERLEQKIGKLQSTIDGFVDQHSEPSMYYKLDVLQPQLPQFPLYTNEAMDDLEEKLMDAEFRSILINELRKLGGKRVTDLVNKQMTFLMDYSLGCAYSYYGTKEKRAFSNLTLCNVIADVVRLFFPTTTNEEMKEPVQTWLRHCKEKCQKKQKQEI